MGPGRRERCDGDHQYHLPPRPPESEVNGVAGGDELRSEESFFIGARIFPWVLRKRYFYYLDGLRELYLIVRTVARGASDRRERGKGRELFCTCAAGVPTFQIIASLDKRLTISPPLLRSSFSRVGPLMVPPTLNGNT